MRRPFFFWNPGMTDLTLVLLAAGMGSRYGGRCVVCTKLTV
jgi:CTP:molybdopterin cytidylyltransferase MocA